MMQLRVGSVLAVVVGRKHPKPYFFQIVHDTPKMWWVLELRYKSKPVPEAHRAYECLPAGGEYLNADDLKGVYKKNMYMSIGGDPHRLKEYKEEVPLVIFDDGVVSGDL